MPVSDSAFISTNTLRGATVRLALILCLLLCCVQHALAQQEIRYPQLLEHGGNQFAAYVNEINGTPTWIIDPDSLDFTLGSPTMLSGESGVRVAADAFVESAKDLFGVDPKKLEGPTISKSAEVWLVSYQQMFSDLRVLGAKLGLAVTRQGRLLAAGARLFPKVSVNTTPSLSAEAAMQAATGHASIPDPDVSAKDELVILAVEESGAYVYSLAWEITVSNLHVKPPRSKTFLVDAHSGKILHEVDNIRNGHRAPDRVVQSQEAVTPRRPSTKLAEDELMVAQAECPSILGASYGIEGTIRLNYYVTPNVQTQPLHREKGAGFPYAKFSVSGEGVSCQGHADAIGNYSVGLQNRGTYTITFYVESDTAHVSSWPSSEPRPVSCLEEKSFTIEVGTVLPEAKLDYNWGWGISGDGGFTAFALNSIYHTRPMLEYYQNTHAASVRPNQAIRFDISDFNSGRVINRDPPTIKISGASAMSNEVVMHEYSHLVIDPLLDNDPNLDPEADKDQEAGIVESSQDYFVADATNNSLFGGPDSDPVGDLVGGFSGITRQLENECTLNYECGSSGAYRVGLILSGAIWKLRDMSRLGPIRATELFYLALAMDPDPELFRHVGSYMHGLAGEGEKAKVEEVFGNRGISVSNPPRDINVMCDTGTPLITWTDVSSIEAGYEIERQTDGGAWQLVARLGPNTETYSDTGASCGGNSQTEYSYHVASFSTYGATNSDTLRTFSVEASYSPNSRGQFRAATLVVPEDLQSEEPATFETELHSVYPNPFNPVTTISYALKEETHVSLVVYDVLGRKVAVLVDGVQTAGAHTIAFDASRLPSGTYFVRMETAAYRQQRMMMLAK